MFEHLINPQLKQRQIQKRQLPTAELQAAGAGVDETIKKRAKAHRAVQSTARCRRQATFRETR
ncbi:MAG TPA: hypothetical protein VGJ10_19960 [Paraburkholderia sp.]